MSRPQLTPGKDTVPILLEAGWASGPVWTGAENLAPTGIRSPDRPARRQSLYRLSYPALVMNCTFFYSLHCLVDILIVGISKVQATSPLLGIFYGVKNAENK